MITEDNIYTNEIEYLENGGQHEVTKEIKNGTEYKTERISDKEGAEHIIRYINGKISSSEIINKDGQKSEAEISEQQTPTPTNIVQNLLKSKNY